MCTNHRPDFNAEEVASVEKDRRYKKLLSYLWNPDSDSPRRFGNKTVWIISRATKNSWYNILILWKKQKFKEMIGRYLETYHRLSCSWVTLTNCWGSNIIWEDEIWNGHLFPGSWWWLWKTWQTTCPKKTQVKVRMYNIHYISYNIHCIWDEYVDLHIRWLHITCQVHWEQILECL